MTYITEEQEDNLIEVFADIFPSSPPTNHENLSACLRYIYGCFDKQGCLLSKKHQKVIARLDWEKQDKFIDKLEKAFEARDNPFGLLVLYEMKAHRTGDKAIVSGDFSLMGDMVKYYELSVSYLGEIRGRFKNYSYRHTPYHWCACYLERCNKNKAVLYHMKGLRMLEKYCADGRKGYREKVAHSVLYIKKNSKPRKWRALRKEISHYKKKCFATVHKVL